MDLGRAQAGQSPLAELIVQTGQDAGVRHQLYLPINLLGSSPDCDLPLDADGVLHQHCVILIADGLIQVRDLAPQAGTWVNGQRVSTAKLRDGDVLTLGSTKLYFEALSESEDEPTTLSFPPAAETDASRDAFRIQVAAVAAQQAALLDEEWRLQQQQEALKQQKEQLAAHLEEKHRHAVMMASKLQAARADLKREREVQSRNLIIQTEQLNKSKQEVDESRKDLQARRDGLLRLRRRLKQHCDRRLAAERQQLRKREQAVSEQHIRIEREAEKLQVERDKLSRARMSFNGEVELGKRMVLADRFEMAQARSQWNHQRDRQAAELAARVELVDKREIDLAEREKTLALAKRELEAQRKLAVKENLGLETRILNQRRKLKESGQWAEASGRKNSGTEAASPPMVKESPAASTSLFRVLHPTTDEETSELEHLADDLADQRLELVEHWQRLVLFHQLWDHAQREVANQIETRAEQIAEQESALMGRQAAVESVEAELRKREQELVDFRLNLEGWAARVRLRETAWEHEKGRLLADLRSVSEHAEHHLASIAGLRQSWAKRRRHELDELRAEYAICEQLRRECAREKQDCWKLQLSLSELQRELADKAATLEETRQQIVLRSPDSAAADLRMEKIRQRWQRESETAMQAIAERHRLLLVDAAGVNSRGAELLKIATELARRDTQLTDERARWEENVMLAQARQRDLQHQLMSAHSQRERCERHLAEVQNEVERLARILLDGASEIEALPAEAA